MVRVPHVYVPGPWESNVLPLPKQKIHHLRSVLRRNDGARVSYTDGRGVAGVGVLGADGLARGEETGPNSRPIVNIAVAAPSRTERLRTLVEKLTELGVASIRWLDTERREGRDPNPEKCAQWAVSALEQSQGSWLPAFHDTVPIAALTWSGQVWVADTAATDRLAPDIGSQCTLVIGPEGGFAPGEIGAGARRFSLGDTTLRTETAAIAAATLAFDRLGP